MSAHPEGMDLRRILEAEDRVIEELRQRRSQITDRLEALRLRARSLVDRAALEHDDAFDGLAAVSRAPERVRVAVERRTTMLERLARAHERAAEAHERAAVARERVGDIAGAGAHRDAAVNDRGRAARARSIASDAEPLPDQAP
jgi:hypothetical protein